MKIKISTSLIFTFLIFTMSTGSSAEETTLQDMMILDTSEKMVNVQNKGVDVFLAEGEMNPVDDEEEEDEE
ncbi:MAG TPA: hypothetical protein VNJ01_13360 [Bacteriovoracaceae bacterium]|nr:hypothetical protein [Bacteriovoracaceae bacterium]